MRTKDFYEQVDPTMFRMAPVFRDVDEGGLARLIAISKLLTVPEGTHLCRQGTPADHLLVLLDGQVALEKTTPSGASAVVEVVQPGGHCMLSAVLSGLPCLMSARTIAAAILIGIDADGLRVRLHRDMSLATALLRAEAIDFGAMVQQICDLKLRTTAQRLGSYTSRPYRRLVCAQGWRGGCARNQYDTSRPTAQSRVKGSAGWY